MVLNVAGCAAALVWTRRRGFYDDIEAASRVVCEDETAGREDER